MNGSTRTIQLAIGLTAAGFLLIVLGWNGAANWDRVPSQVPYLLSGGIAGLGLVLIGLVLALVQELRRNTAVTVAKLDELGERLATAAGSAAGPTAVPQDAGVVVAGRSSYHRSDCTLVEGRGDLQPMALGTAADRGLAPCRICEPRDEPREQAAG